MQFTVVANRAPIRKTDEGWETSIGGLASALLPVLEAQGGTWVAMGEDETLPERQAYPEGDPDFRVRRVPLSEEELNGYYYGMANRVLWPVSHYMIQHLDLDPSFYEIYKSVNERFARAVLEEHEAGAGGYVWVQDYHLMLAPALIRAERPEAVLGHFWHIPWPAMEVFRILPWARELMRGMLGCDLIGFHVEEYVENFIESARVLLGAEVEQNLIRWEGREVRVEAHPIGIDVARFEQMAAQEHVRAEAEELREEMGVEHVVVGIDRLDYTKGVLSRLEAFEQFLEEHPEYHEHVAFFQVATPSRTEVEEYQQLKREVDEAVGRINGAFAEGTWTPVHYRFRTYTQEELCAFYQAADAALITPLRDGMNVVTQEFVTATTERGVLILSELTGAAYLLPEAVQVNPYDRGGLAAAIKQAIDMPADERRARIQKLKESVAALDVHQWADGFLRSLRNVR